MNILIVDDRPSNLKLLRAVLEAEGITVCEAADGLEAISMLMRGRVDAIISDILMPRMDGYRLCMEVRAHHRFCDLPFIAYTATYTSARDEKLMTALGADRFLRKPTSAAVLTATVEDVVQAKRRRPPTPARIRPEPELLEEYNERLAAKLEERNVAREAKTEPAPAIEHHGLPSSTQWQRWLDHSPAMIYGLKWENEKIIPCLISESMSHFLGFTVAECMNGEWWVGQLHPDDRVAAVASILETVALGFTRIEYRLRHRDGSIRWVEDQRRSIADTAGHPVELAGTWTDITERKKTEKNRLRQRERWRALVAISTHTPSAGEEERIALVHTDAARIISSSSLDLLLRRDVADRVQQDGCEVFPVPVPPVFPNRPPHPFDRTLADQIRPPQNQVAIGLLAKEAVAVTAKAKRAAEAESATRARRRPASAEVETSADRDLPRGAGERILFVDDEAGLAEVGKLMLDHLGYATDTCSNAQQAIDLVTARPAVYALVITDQSMPGLTGLDLAHQLSAIHPDLPIILTTGCTDLLLPDRLRAAGIRQLLAKPFSAQGLAMAVHGLLSTPA